MLQYAMNSINIEESEVTLAIFIIECGAQLRLGSFSSNKQPLLANVAKSPAHIHFHFFLRFQNLFQKSRFSRLGYFFELKEMESNEPSVKMTNFLIIFNDF